MNKFTLTVAASALALGLAAPASAATYVSQASFLSAHSGATTTSFSGLGTLTALSSPFTVGAITASAPNLFAVSTAFWGSVDSLLSNTFQSTLDATFASSTAVGFFLAGGYNNGSQINVNFYNGATLLSSSTVSAGGVYGQFSYFGIDGIGAITGIRLDASPFSGSFASLGPVSLDNGGAVPEPAAWALMIAGFGLVGAAARRRQSVRVAYA